MKYITISEFQLKVINNLMSILDPHYLRNSVNVVIISNVEEYEEYGHSDVYISVSNTMIVDFFEGDVTVSSLFPLSEIAQVIEEKRCPMCNGFHFDLNIILYDPEKESIFVVAKHVLPDLVAEQGFIKKCIEQYYKNEGADVTVEI